MSRLSRKLAIILLIVLMVAVILNTVFLYRSVNRYDLLQLHQDAKNKAVELADYLAGNLRELEMTDDLEDIINLVDAKVIIFTNKRRIIYANVDQVNISSLLQDDNLLAARAGIQNAGGDDIASVVVLEVRRSTQINNIFKLAIIGSLILGIILIALFLLIMYLMVTRPLKKITKAMASDEAINIENKDWQVVTQVHNHAHKRRQEQKEAQNLFFQNASHELKSPLMNIQGYMEALEDGLYDQKEASELVVAESQRIKNLVDQMIRSSKAESVEQGDIHPEEIDMASFIEDLKKMVSKPLTVEYIGDTSIIFDRTILQVIMDNLIQNACRYTEQIIRIVYQSGPDGFTIKVMDDGAGIEPQLQGHIFDRFAKGKDGRTGLGLSIVKQYVEATGGSIKAYNDGGAVFEMEWYTHETFK